MITPKRAPDHIENGMFFRHETEDAMFEVGIYPFFYGFLIRAGEVGSYICRLDMRIGDKWFLMYAIFSILCDIVE